MQELSVPGKGALEGGALEGGALEGGALKGNVLGEQHNGAAVPSTRRPLPPDRRGHDLTERERQVLIGMSQGKTNQEIGRELYLSQDTVKTHARRLFRKLGAEDRAHAVALGFRQGLVR